MCLPTPDPAVGPSVKTCPPQHPDVHCSNCNAVAALPASQSFVIKVKKQSFSQHQAQARRDVPGAAIRVVRSGSDTSMTASSRPRAHLTLSVVDLWRETHGFAPQRSREQGVHPSVQPACRLALFEAQNTWVTFVHKHMDTSKRTIWPDFWKKF